MKTGFVFTNYNNSHYTKQVIHSISLNEEWNDCKVVIVDNNSESKDVYALESMMKEYNGIKLILNETNLGYFRGLNVGIKYLRNNFPNINLIVIGNNDLVFPLDFIKKLKASDRTLNSYPVISPDLVTLDGVHQNPHVIEKISSAREFIYDVYYSNYYLSLIIGYLAKVTKSFTDRKDEEQFEVARTIYQGYGACYILTDVFFQNFDELWAPTFLMGEEFFLSRQLEEKGFKVYYEPALVVSHHDHATMAKLPSNKLWNISRESHGVYRGYLNKSLKK